MRNAASLARQATLSLVGCGFIACGGNGNTNIYAGANANGSSSSSSTVAATGTGTGTGTGASASSALAASTGTGTGTGTGASSSSSSGSAGEDDAATGGTEDATAGNGSGDASGGGGGEGGAAGCPAGAVFCDGFEASTTLGAAWTMDNTLGATIKVVDTYTTMPGPTMAHSGSNSVQISFTTGSGYGMIVEKMGFPATAGYWGRVWLYVETPMDQGHDVYIEGSTGVVTTLGNNGVRPLNTQSGDMSINIDPATGGGEASASTGMPLARGAWTCFEWQISATGGTGNVVLYVGGSATASATVKIANDPGADRAARRLRAVWGRHRRQHLDR